MTLDPNAWAERMHRNGQRAGRNQMMDSGWSANVQDSCTQTNAMLLMELYRELAKVEIKPEDAFDRPALFAVLAAVHEAERLTKTEGI